MITTVYFSQQGVRALQGSGGSHIRVQQACHIALPEGCFINGVITDADALQTALATLWQQNHLPKKGVRMVLSSSLITIKELELPRLSRKKLLALLPRELEETRSGGAQVQDYLPLPGSAPSAGLQVLGIQAEREMLEAYVQLFHRIGVQVEQICPARISLVRLAAAAPAMQQKTCLFQVLDANTVTSLLLSRGRYCYSARSRLFSEPDDPSFAEELARTVSQTLQFSATREDIEPVHEVCIAGNLTPPQRQRCEEALREMELTCIDFPMKNAQLPQGMSPQQCLMELGCFLPGGIDLRRALRHDPARSARRLQRLRAAVPSLAVAGVMAVACAGLWGVGQYRQAQLDEVNTYLADPEKTAQMQQQAEWETQAALQQAQADALNELAQTVGSYPVYDHTVTDAVLACGGSVQIELQDYVAETGALSLLATVSQVTEANAFVDRLADTGLFRQVAYSGYTYQSESDTYRLQVVCYLAERTGG